MSIPHRPLPEPEPPAAAPSEFSQFDLETTAPNMPARSAAQAALEEQAYAPFMKVANEARTEAQKNLENQ